jgi:undecaprenyl-diphosphatase
VVQHRTPWLDDFFVALSHVGSYGLVWLVLALLATLLWRRPSIFLFVLAGSLISGYASFGLRQAVGRDRPPHRFPDPPPLVETPVSDSFPSGHASTAFACAALLAWLTPLPKLPLFALAALIAFSRVYNGVHYPLDVIGGAVFGLAVATALRLLAGARRRSAPGPR